MHKIDAAQRPSSSRELVEMYSQGDSLRQAWTVRAPCPHKPARNPLGKDNRAGTPPASDTAGKFSPPRTPTGVRISASSILSAYGHQSKSAYQRTRIGRSNILVCSHGYSSGNWTCQNFYHADGNGNVTALADSGGTLQASYIYDPYGRHLAGAGALLTSNVMRFSSKPWVSSLSSSATTGLYYYGYRFYDPYSQRWLNRDPLPRDESANLYFYVANSPLWLADAHG
ncbi:MAG: RHS repeat-associated core domain-containing protein, partial [Verrucomicrobia bacterium]|nr:RHS repeat-associated core domain-containing protein [Verrucomicrobiota bacterium]